MQALLHEYPIDLVLNLYRAALQNQLNALKAGAIGQSVAITNALDMAFNNGKGQIMKNWLRAMDGRDSGPPEKVPASPQVMAFFMGLPQKKRE